MTSARAPRGADVTEVGIRRLPVPVMDTHTSASWVTVQCGWFNSG